MQLHAVLVNLLSSWNLHPHKTAQRVSKTVQRVSKNAAARVSRWVRDIHWVREIYTHETVQCVAKDAAARPSAHELLDSFTPIIEKVVSFFSRLYCHFFFPCVKMQRRRGGIFLSVVREYLYLPLFWRHSIVFFGGVCRMWLIRTCDMRRLYVMTHLHVWHDSFICVT